jgi:hypothetical protein
VSLQTASISQCQNVGKEFAFELTAQSSSDVKEVMVLAAPSQEEMISWIRTICRIVPCEADWIAQISISPSSPEPRQEDTPMSDNNKAMTAVVVVETAIEATQETTIHERKSAAVEEGTRGAIEETQKIETAEAVVETTAPSEDTTRKGEEVIVLVPKSEILLDKKETRTAVVVVENKSSDRVQSDSNQSEPRGGAPFLRGSSGYDFGSRAEKLSFNPSAETIAEESDAAPLVEVPRTPATPTQPPPRVESDVLVPSSSHIEPRPPPSVSWRLTCHCTNIFPRIGQKLMKRCHLHQQLFPHSDSHMSADWSTLLDFHRVKELLLSENPNEPTVSLPYLSTNGCTWSQILKYLKYMERNNTSHATDGQIAVSTSALALDCSLYNDDNSTEVNFHLTVSLDSANESLVDKVHSLASLSFLTPLVDLISLS